MNVEEVFNPFGRPGRARGPRPGLHAALTALLRDSPRLVLVHGPPVAGKSSLVEEVLLDLGCSAVTTTCDRRWTAAEHLLDAAVSLAGLGAAPDGWDAVTRAVAPMGVRDYLDNLPGRRRAGIPGVPVGRLVGQLGRAGHAWVLDDVHKLPADGWQAVLAAVPGGPGPVVIAVGTAAPAWPGARPSGAGPSGVPALAVPPLSAPEIEAGLRAGFAALGLVVPAAVVAAWAADPGLGAARCQALAYQVALAVGAHARPPGAPARTAVGEDLCAAATERFRGTWTLR
ncbi:ATP-binding protein [Frankia sp. CcWB3]